MGQLGSGGEPHIARAFLWRALAFTVLAGAFYILA